MTGIAYVVNSSWSSCFLSYSRMSKNHPPSVIPG